MKNLFFIGLATLTLATACKKDKDPAPAPMQISGALTGANETPAVTTSATGNVTGTYDKSTKTLTYSITYSGLAPTLGHFHIGAPGTAGPVAITFPYLQPAPINGTVVLTDSQAEALLAGNMYANLHTAANGGGEIRANVVAK